ncbi:LysE family translocator [Celeribacter neptunius]|uniref:Threonine/homoserine/homoserine lactone efflux protein n=1 Tax=Celeribacter neptunius TaxID=588602 RepID=A0A1I3KCY5_9RHOB|nr:LysE family translocator [Celeribacter neptunius]SFI70381.1 Threonine/homoserine/homoserine lactone efflux protein [Celeribacter neptunius]
MFDYSFLHWTTFLSAALALNLVPGPDFAFILGHTFKGGRRAGFVAMFGIWSGAFVHVLMAALGLSAILMTSALAFSAVKWLGAAYLIWLGIEALRSKGGAFIPEADGNIAQPLPRRGTWSVFRAGMLTNILNPKVALFFLAFLPQFVVEGAGPISAQLFLHGVLIIAIAAFIEPPLILMGDRLGARLRRSQRLALWMERSVGAILIALGLRLALEKR